MAEREGGSMNFERWLPMILVIAVAMSVISVVMLK